MYQYLGDTDILMYDLLGILSFVPVHIFNFSQYILKKSLLGRLPTFVLEHAPKSIVPFCFNLVVSLEILIVSVFQYSFTAPINSAFGHLFNTGSNYYGLLYVSPIIVAFICFFLGINFLKQLDLIVPAYPLALIILKIACFCAGCCKGIPCDFGLYNHNTELVEFPVQLVEAGLALLIFIFLMHYRKRAKEGTMFPVYLIVYSSTRFFSEFLRADPDIVWKLKKYHLLCIAGFIIGIIEFFIAKKFKDKITLLFEEIPRLIIKIFHQCALIITHKSKEAKSQIAKKRKQAKKLRAAKWRAKKGIKITPHKKRKHKKK